MSATFVLLLEDRASLVEECTTFSPGLPLKNE